MSHWVEIWRSEDRAGGVPPLAARAASEDLPRADAIDDLVVELMRCYPGLTRALAEYLLR
jgi:hypothetical protein